ncbi:hypothetical protein Acsp01_91000 [Actinoplanes sp. NBRC 101535]|nr:hypothetical protein Acsp01_91000 [Actinoplanes sp. NBRC 101535]
MVVSARLAVGAVPAQTLLEEARGAALLVVGHRHGATSTALGRSVADRVGREHPGPVLVVRMPGWPVGAEFGRRPLVVAVDSSESSRVAVGFALAEAGSRVCDVTVLHVVGDRAGLVGRGEERGGVPVHHRVLSGDPAAVLVEESGRAAAVVIGRHGVGSVLSPAVRMLQERAYCPVFLVG